MTFFWTDIHCSEAGAPPAGASAWRRRDPIETESRGIVIARSSAANFDGRMKSEFAQIVKELGASPFFLPQSTQRSQRVGVGV